MKLWGCSSSSYYASEIRSIIRQRELKNSDIDSSDCTLWKETIFGEWNIIQNGSELQKINLLKLSIFQTNILIQFWGQRASKQRASPTILFTACCLLGLLSRRHKHATKTSINIYQTILCDSTPQLFTVTTMRTSIQQRLRVLLRRELKSMRGSGFEKTAQWRAS
jgi:hypothetical protein